MQEFYNIFAEHAFLALLAISFCSSSRNRFLMASDRLSSLSWNKNNVLESWWLINGLKFGF